MVLAAALMISIGFVEFELAAVAVGSVLGAGGTGTIWWGLKARQDRRRALMTRLQRRVLLLATEKGGTLTVTEVAASLNLAELFLELGEPERAEGYAIRGIGLFRLVQNEDFPNNQVLLARITAAIEEQNDEKETQK